MTAVHSDATVRTARREAFVVLLIFTAALVYTVSVCYWLGYDRPPETLAFIAGIPDWVFYGVVLPWGVCLALSFWFGYLFMQDVPLGNGDPSAVNELEDDDE